MTPQGTVCEIYHLCKTVVAICFLSQVSPSAIVTANISGSTSALAAIATTAHTFLVAFFVAGILASTPFLISHSTYCEEFTTIRSSQSSPLCLPVPLLCIGKSKRSTSCVNSEYSCTTLVPSFRRVPDRTGDMTF